MEEQPGAQKPEEKAADKLDILMLLNEYPVKLKDKVGLFILMKEHPEVSCSDSSPEKDGDVPEVHSLAREMMKKFAYPVPPGEEKADETEFVFPEPSPKSEGVPLDVLLRPRIKNADIPAAPEAAKAELPPPAEDSKTEAPVPLAKPKPAVLAPAANSGLKPSPEEIEDILLSPRTDRRLLSNVPDAEKNRSKIDRRGQKTLEEFKGDVMAYVKSYQYGIRYEVNYPVEVICRPYKGRRLKFTVPGIDISTTGLLLQITDPLQAEALKGARKIRLKFRIEPGTMPEGYEMAVRVYATLARRADGGDGKILCGMQFSETLAQYARRTRGRYMLTTSATLLFVISLFVILMRAESVIYFEFNKYFYLYSIIAAVFLLSRYFFGAGYKPVPIDPEFTPGVTVIIPCFNEEQWIDRTITSCLNQDYPIDKLEILVVDDHSSDNSVEVIRQTIERLHNEEARFKTHERVSYVVQEKNAGKREALARGAGIARHELLVFVDSDSFLDPFAIRNLVQPFKDPKIGGISGRTDVANTFTNSLTKMQSVRYYIAFRIMKAAEAFFDAVTCLSGPLACYRKEIVLEHREEWLNQRFLGQKATFGDDRSMTNFVLQKHRTGYQDTAICSTIVPNQYKVFLKQQMRWKRSWLRESILAGKFMWKKEPFASLLFYIGLLVPVAAPVIVLYNLIYVPIIHRVFPLTFLVGLLMMSLLMSFAQLFLRKSSTWAFGLLFCLFYEGVLLWQMPVAWFTFWKSTWGTRLTPEDVKANAKKEAKLLKKQKKKQKPKP